MKSIKTYFEALFKAPEKTQATNQHVVELAIAALMIEISLADDNIDDQEYHTIKTLLLRQFKLAAAEIDNFIELAKNEVDRATSLYQFTRLLNDSLDKNEKIKIIEGLWQIAYADNIIHKYEEYYIRKIADLLYIPHSVYIKSKLSAAAKR